jgi:hypothetical protein
MFSYQKLRAAHINGFMSIYTVTANLVDCMLKGSHHKWPTLPEPFEQFVLYLSKIFPSLPLLLQSVNKIQVNYSDMYEYTKLFTDIQAALGRSGHSLGV